MINALISGVVWPPGYYIMRDRIPFFMTILYVFGSKIPLFSKYTQARLGIVLTLETAAVSLVAVYLYFTEDSMAKIAGINWSAPSPIQWGVFITASTLFLVRRRIPIFEAYYLSFLAALGGAWFYEFLPFLIPLLGNRYSWFVFFKVNAVKVFFIEFQVLCLPILAYIIYKTKEYEAHWSLKITVPLTVLFYGFNQQVIAFVQRNLLYSYRWWVRLPAIFFLWSIILGIKGEKKVDGV